MDIFAQYSLKDLGSLVDHRTVRLGSGAVPRFVQCVEVAEGGPCHQRAPVDAHASMDSVTQVGSPEKRELYSGVRANLTRRSFMMKWSMYSCACSSVMRPLSRSLWM